MKILLTGAGGFIGSAFARLASSRGHSIGGLLIPGEPVPVSVPVHPRVTWFRGTLSDTPWEEIRAFQPQVCVHTAWITTPGVYLQSPENYRFLETSRRFAEHATNLGVRHLVSLGTCIEYQITGTPLSEDHTPVLPGTTYARCKNELRLALEADAKERGYGLAWARVFYPYGPGEHPSRLCSSIIEKLSRDEPVILKTPESTKDYIFIEDLALALLTIVEREFVGTINLGTGMGVSVRQIARTLGSLLNKPGLIREEPVPGPDPFGYVVADAGRLRGLGWKPAYDLEAGLQALLPR